MKMIKYKLIDKNGCTGESNSTYWLDGQWKEAVVHWYSNPKLALIFNPIHANIANPRMIEIEIEGIVDHNGLQGGSKKARFVREIPVPEITLIQKVEFAIRISLTYYREKTYVTWAENWLSGKDRSAEAAWAAEAAARKAVEWEVMYAEAAAWAAEAAAREREAAEAGAVIREAGAVAWAAGSVAREIEAAEAAKLFIKIIEEVTENKL